MHKCAKLLTAVSTHVQICAQYCVKLRLFLRTSAQHFAQMSEMWILVHSSVHSCGQLGTMVPDCPRLCTIVHECPDLCTLLCASVSKPCTIQRITAQLCAILHASCAREERTIVHNYAQLSATVSTAVQNSPQRLINFCIFSYDSAYQCARMADSSLPMNNSSRLLRSSSSSLPRNTSSSLPRSSSSALPGHLPTAAASCRISQRRLALIISPFQTCGSHKRRKKGSVTHRPVTWA